MTANRFNTVTRLTARAAIVAAGMYLAFAVGAPWIIRDAPPTLLDVVAAKVCCAKPAAAK